MNGVERKSDSVTATRHTFIWEIATNICRLDDTMGGADAAHALDKLYLSKDLNKVCCHLQ